MHGVELSWNDVKRRCNELGINYVPELNAFTFDATDNKDTINSIVQTMVSGVSTLDNRHIREGVVIRIESDKGTMVFKEKSFDFKVLEGIVKSDDNFVDREESA
jgi:hypothetical protein